MAIGVAFNRAQLRVAFVLVRVFNAVKGGPVDIKNNIKSGGWALRLGPRLETQNQNENYQPQFHDDP